jgi:hypothetical protein
MQQCRYTPLKWLNEVKRLGMVHPGVRPAELFEDAPAIYLPNLEATSPQIWPKWAFCAQIRQFWAWRWQASGICGRWHSSNNSWEHHRLDEPSQRLENSRRGSNDVSK